MEILFVIAFLLYGAGMYLAGYRKALAMATKDMAKRVDELRKEIDDTN